MRREHSLRKRLHSLETLSEAIGAMRSLAAHHFRTARSALPAAQAYREGIDQALRTVSLHHPPPSGDAAGILLIAADLGLCNGYNSQLTAKAIEQHRLLDARRMYSVGRRPRSALRREGITVQREYTAATSTAGLTELLLHLAEDLLDDYLNGRFGSLTVVSARFDGVGSFTPVSHRLLPIDKPDQTEGIAASSYVSIQHLAAIAVREYLYISLFQTALESLASEHGTRLVATEAAGEWLTQKIEATRQQLAATRREAATQEVLDIASTAKRRRRRSRPQ